jgi:Putative Ig domain
MTKSVAGTIAILLILGVGLVYGADLGESPSGPPTIAQAKFTPPNPVSDQPIKLEIKLGGTAIRAEVRWSINNEEVETSDYDGLGKPVELNRKTTAGDKVSAVIIPYDAMSAAGAKMTKKVVVGNAPPVVKVMDEKVEGSTYSAHVQAKDPQGGPITFTINRAPKGLTIDPQGNIKWPISPKISGSFPVQITASDKRGAKTMVILTINLHWNKGK